MVSPVLLWAQERSGWNWEVVLGMSTLVNRDRGLGSSSLGPGWLGAGPFFRAPTGGKAQSWHVLGEKRH